MGRAQVGAWVANPWWPQQAEDLQAKGVRWGDALIWLDLRWWRDQERVTRRLWPDDPRRWVTRPSRRELCRRWGCTDGQKARRLLREEHLWLDPHWARQDEEWRAEDEAAGLPMERWWRGWPTQERPSADPPPTQERPNAGPSDAENPAAPTQERPSADPPPTQERPHARSFTPLTPAPSPPPDTHPAGAEVAPPAERAAEPDQVCVSELDEEEVQAAAVSWWGWWREQLPELAQRPSQADHQRLCGRLEDTARERACGGQEAARLCRLVVTWALRSPDGDARWQRGEHPQASRRDGARPRRLLDPRTWADHLAAAVAWEARGAPEVPREGPGGPVQALVAAEEAEVAASAPDPAPAQDEAEASAAARIPDLLDRCRRADRVLCGWRERLVGLPLPAHVPGASYRERAEVGAARQARAELLHGLEVARGALARAKGAHPTAVEAVEALQAARAQAWRARSDAAAAWAAAGQPPVAQAQEAQEEVDSVRAAAP